MFTFVDLFSGIGGFTLPLLKEGARCIGISEIDDIALSTFYENFPSIKNYGDVRSIDKFDEKPNLIVGGVPCQSWSIAGNNDGFEDTRGKLWKDVIRIVDINKPEWFIFENVKGLADPRHSEELSLILHKFKSSGYSVSFEKLNAVDFGLPQHRVRTFIIGNREGKELSFPPPKNNKPQLSDVLEERVPTVTHNVDLIRDKMGKLSASRRICDNVADYFIFNDVRNGPTTIHSWQMMDVNGKKEEICHAILDNRRKNEYGEKDGNPMSLEDIESLVGGFDKSYVEELIDLEILEEIDGKYDFVNRRISSGIGGIYRIFVPEASNYSTLTASSSNDKVATVSIGGKTVDEYKRNLVSHIIDKDNYRSLTNRERARLQGFPDNFIFPNSQNSTRKMIGNAVPINVVDSLIDRLNYN